jgi:hypothetical protein
VGGCAGGQWGEHRGWVESIGGGGGGAVSKSLSNWHAFSANRGVSKIKPPSLAKTHRFGTSKMVRFIFQFFFF